MFQSFLGWLHSAGWFFCSTWHLLGPLTTSQLGWAGRYMDPSLKSHCHLPPSFLLLLLFCWHKDGLSRELTKGFSQRNDLRVVNILYGIWLPKEKKRKMLDFLKSGLRGSRTLYPSASSRPKQITSPAWIQVEDRLHLLMEGGREESDGGHHWILSTTNIQRELWEVRLERLLEVMESFAGCALFYGAGWLCLYSSQARLWW